MSCSRTIKSYAGEARTHGPSVSSQAPDNVDMHLYAKFEPYGSRVMSIFLLTDHGWTHIVSIVQTEGACNVDGLK